MAKFQFLLSVWEEVEVPDDKVQEIQDKIESGLITSTNGVYDELDGVGVEHEQLEDTEFYPSVEQNHGLSTIQIIDDNCETIWENGK